MAKPKSSNAAVQSAARSREAAKRERPMTREESAIARAKSPAGALADVLVQLADVGKLLASTIGAAHPACVGLRGVYRQVDGERLKFETLLADELGRRGERLADAPADDVPPPTDADAPGEVDP